MTSSPPAPASAPSTSSWSREHIRRRKESSLPSELGLNREDSRTNDGRLHAERRGSGEPLLLVHGLGATWESWSLILDDLARHREVVAIDLPADVALREMRSFAQATSLYDALVDGPLQQSAPAGSTPGRITLGWGRQDRVTLPAQAARAQQRFPVPPLRW